MRNTSWLVRLSAHLSALSPLSSLSDPHIAGFGFTSLPTQELICFPDPLLYDRLVRKFQTPAEREVEGKAKGYSRVLESSLLRGEARLADLKSSTDDTSTAEPARDFTTEADLSKTKTKEEGLQRWHEFLTERFVRGHDEDFDYSLIDDNEDYDVMERRDAEEAWFDEEDPEWASDAGEGVQTARGQTGIQDF